MGFLSKIDKIFSKVEEFIISYSIILMAGVLIGNVISRSVFNQSWTWAEEVGQTLVIAVTFIGVSYAARQGRHINMSAFFDMMSPKVKKFMIILISLVTSVVLFYLAYLGLEYTLKVKELMRVTPALRVPMYMVTALVPIGFFLGGVQYLHNAVINIKEKEIYLGTETTANSEASSIDY